MLASVRILPNHKGVCNDSHTKAQWIAVMSLWARWRLKPPAPRLFAVCSDVDKKNQNSTSLAFLRGIRRSPADSHHKGPVTRKMLPFDDVIMDYYLTADHLACALWWLCSRPPLDVLHNLASLIKRRDDGWCHDLILPAKTPKTRQVDIHPVFKTIIFPCFSVWCGAGNVCCSDWWIKVCHAIL